MKKAALVLATVVTLGVTAVAAPAPAEALIGGLASNAYGYGPGYGYYGGYAPAYYGGYTPAYYGGYSEAYYDDYAPAYYGYRYRRVVRPAFAYYGGPRYYGGWHHRWHPHW